MLFISNVLDNIKESPSISKVKRQSNSCPARLNYYSKFKPKKKKRKSAIDQLFEDSMKNTLSNEEVFKQNQEKLKKELIKVTTQKIDLI